MILPGILVLVALVASGFAGATHVQVSPEKAAVDMSPRRAGAEQSVKSAHAAIIALRATISRRRSVLPNRVAFAAAGDVLMDAEAARRLAALGGPIECRAMSTESGTLILECHPSTPTGAWERAFLHESSSLVHHEGRELLSTASSPKVLIVGRNETLVLPWTEFLEFERRYLILGSYVASGRIPNPLEHSNGAQWVVEFGPDE